MYDNASGAFKAIREINLGDELFYDYGSVEDENIL